MEAERQIPDGVGLAYGVELLYAKAPTLDAQRLLTRIRQRLPPTAVRASLLLCLLWLACPAVTASAPARQDAAGGYPALTAVERSAGVAALPPAFLGAWGGSGAQVEPVMAYPVLVLLTGGDEATPVGFIDYPAFPCGGPVVLVAATEREVEVVEQMDYGQEYCDDQGRVRLSRRSDGALDYTWTPSDAAPDAPPAVTGVLKRRSTLTDA